MVPEDENTPWSVSNIYYLTEQKSDFQCTMGREGRDRISFSILTRSEWKCLIRSLYHCRSPSGRPCRWWSCHYGYYFLNCFMTYIYPHVSPSVPDAKQCFNSQCFISQSYFWHSRLYSSGQVSLFSILGSDLPSGSRDRSLSNRSQHRKQRLIILVVAVLLNDFRGGKRQRTCNIVSLVCHQSIKFLCPR